MAEPYFYPRLIEPPRPEEFPTPTLYKFFYDLWNRTGGYTSYIANLIGLKASVTELNTLVGIDTSQSVQEQLNLKINVFSLGTMAYEESNNVSITGGALSGISLNTADLSNVNIATSNIYNLISIPMGTSPDYAEGIGHAFSDITSVFTTGATQENLMFYAMPANVLITAQDRIDFKALGKFAPNANNKILRVQFGSQELYNSGIITSNDSSWIISGSIIFLTTVTGLAYVTITSSDATFVAYGEVTDLTENFSNSLTLKITGQGVANADITQNALWVTYCKAP